MFMLCDDGAWSLLTTSVGGYGSRRFAGTTKNIASPLRTKPSHVLAAIDVDLGAVHVRARLRAQHIDDLGDFVRRAEAMHRDLLLDDLLGAGRQDRGVDLAGRDRVDADAEPAEIGSHLAGQGGERGL